MPNNSLSEHALFLPPGSVRAILALALVGGTIYSYLTTPGDTADELVTLTYVVVAFYFGTKSGVTRDGA